MVNVIVSLVLLGIFSMAIGKLVKDKRNGVKCIGCPNSPKKSDNIVQIKMK